MQNFISVAEAAARFNISNRRVQLLCEQGRIENAERISGVWLIPAYAQKPVDGRKKIQTDSNQLTLFDIQTGQAKNLMDFSSVCEELSISTATGRNWIKLGKLNPVEKNGRSLLFSRNDIDEILRSISSGESKALNRRRNKKQIKGLSICENYISDTHNIDIVSKIASIVETDMTDDFLRLLLANFSLQLIYQANNKKIHDGNLIADFVSNKIEAGAYKPLIEDLLSGVSDLSFLNRHEVFSQIIKFNANEDTLGFAYISLVNLGHRKARGSYYTPLSVVNTVISSIAENVDLSEKSIFDPCCGAGNFILAMGDYVTSHDFLYGQDIDLLAIQLTRLSFSLRYKITNMEFLYSHFTCSDTLIDAPKQTYDIILGNPPWGGELGKDYSENLLRLYSTAAVRGTDTYDLFIEQSLRLLNDGGLLAFVLPEALLNVAAHSKVRELLVKSCNFKFTHYLGNVFNGVQCPSIVLGAQKTQKRKSGVEKVYANGECYTLRSNRQLSSERFNFHVTDEVQDCLDELDNVAGKTTLNGQAKFALGIVTGDNNAYTSDVCAEGYEPVVKGSDIKKYQVGAGSRYIKFTPQNFQQVAPTELYRSPEKLLYRFICDTLVFAYDDKQTLSLNSCNLLIPQIPNLSVKFILAILNSRAANFYFINMFNSVKVLRSHIEQIPIPMITPEEEAQVVSMVNHIIDGVENPSMAYDELDDYIMSLYGLSGRAQQIIIDSLANRNLFLPN